MDQSVIPECYVDTNIVETLVPPVKEYNHQKGCGTVTKVMIEKFADRFALGIIDKDKREVDYLKEFSVLCASGSIILHQHHSRPHYIIQISPAIERFLLTSAGSAGISMAQFDLPADFEALKKVSKTTVSKNDIRFKKLVKALYKNGEPEITRLSKLVRYLKDQNYSADKLDLIAMF